MSVPDLAVAGPLAQSATDIEGVMDLLAGAEDELAIAWRYSMPPARHSRIEDFRVGVWSESDVCPVGSEVAAHLDGVLSRIEAAGAKLDRRARPDIDATAAHQMYELLVHGQQAPGFPTHVLKDADASYGELDVSDHSGRAMVVRGIAQRHREWSAINERRHRLRVRWADWFQRFDVLITPMAPVVAFPHDHTPFATRTIDIDGADHPYHLLAFWPGLTGSVLLPSTVAPAGLCPAGVPIGIQIVAPYLEDRTSIRFAQLLEPILGGAVALPPS